MNLNINSKQEYKLYGDLTHEYIKTFGVECKYYITEKIRKDDVLGEHHRIKYNPRKGHKITIAPSNTENWEGGNVFNQMGFQNNESLVAYISKKDMEKIHPKIIKKEGNNFDEILGDIVIFDSGKIMEVVSFSPLSEGSLNNLFVYSDPKNIYKITLKTHIEQHDDYTDLKNADEFDVDAKVDLEKIENLEKIFGLDKEQKEAQETKKRKTRVKSEAEEENANSNYNSLFGSIG